ncbi:MAG: hypothetical protein MZU84_04810 [Sphingobacterium sp.]|nr:hypothetical protein [Sphingobacterium sp.]
MIQKLGDVVAGTGAGLVLMHMRGRPRDDVPRGELRRRHRGGVGGAAAGARARRRRRCAARSRDPRPRNRLRQAGGPEPRAAREPARCFAQLGRPLLVGPSRKSFLLDGQAPLPPAGRDWGTAAAVDGCRAGRGAHRARAQRRRDGAGRRGSPTRFGRRRTRSGAAGSQPDPGRRGGLTVIDAPAVPGRDGRMSSTSSSPPSRSMSC